MWSSPIPTAIDALSPRLIKAYRRTSYVTQTTEVRIGHRSTAMDRLLARFGSTSAVFVTAWNPHSRLTPLRSNQRMQDRLREFLRRQVTLPAHGSWRRWREDHVLVFADPRLVIRIARRFRQTAVVVVKAGQAAALTTSLPSFSPRNSMPNARGAFSSPSTI